jgi:hypothetical protein
MSRIDGVSRPAWPPLRISYAEGPSKRHSPPVEVAAEAASREDDLSRILDQRLTGVLTGIRIAAFGAPSNQFTNASEAGSSTSTPGTRLDILA